MSHKGSWPENVRETLHIRATVASLLAMRALPLRFAVLGLLMAGLVATGCTSDGGQSLTIYSGRTSELILPILEDFADETGIDISV